MNAGAGLTSDAGSGAGSDICPAAAEYADDSAGCLRLDEALEAVFLEEFLSESVMLEFYGKVVGKAAGDGKRRPPLAVCHLPEFLEFPDADSIRGILR